LLALKILPMAKSVAKKTSKSILTPASFSFFKSYINNASPVGFESWGQRLWIDYLKPISLPMVYCI